MTCPEAEWFSGGEWCWDPGPCQADCHSQMEKLPQGADIDFHAAKIPGHWVCGLMLNRREKAHRTRAASLWAPQGGCGPLEGGTGGSRWCRGPFAPLLHSLSHLPPFWLQPKPLSLAWPTPSSAQEPKGYLTQQTKFLSKISPPQSRGDPLLRVHQLSHKYQTNRSTN